MKKKIFGMLGALFSAALCAAAFTACDNSAGGGDSNQTGYTITFANTDNYTLTVATYDGTNLTSGSTVEADTYIYVTAETKDYATYIDKVYYNKSSCSQNTSGQYYFKMPEQNVTITADTANYTEVKESGILSLTDDTVTTIPVNGKNSPYGYEINSNLWYLYVDLNNTSSLITSLKYSFTTSDADVVPLDAITTAEYRNYDRVGSNGTNAIEQVRIIIDTTKISAGDTWITVKITNTSSTSQSGTLCFKLTVTAES